MNLPQLPPEPIRPEEDLDADKEIWQPRWRCFCCEDTGTISPSLVKLVIAEYNYSRHKTVACRHPRCEAGRRYQGNPNYDQRFTAEICNNLDQINREDWRNVVEGKFALTQKMRAENEALIAQMKMPGSRDSASRAPEGLRTANDEREVQQRKQEVEAISHEQWLEMSHQYLGGDEQDSSMVM